MKEPANSLYRQELTERVTSLIRENPAAFSAFCNIANRVSSISKQEEHMGLGDIKLLINLLNEFYDILMAEGKIEEFLDSLHPKCRVPF